MKKLTLTEDDFVLSVLNTNYDKVNKSFKDSLTDEEKFLIKQSTTEIFNLRCVYVSNMKRELTYGKVYKVPAFSISLRENDVIIVSDYGQPINVSLDRFEKATIN